MSHQGKERVVIHYAGRQLSEFAQHLCDKLREADRREKEEMAYEKEINDRLRHDDPETAFWSEDEVRAYQERHQS